MQQVDDPPFLSEGTAVSARYKGAFCEAKIQRVVRNIKCLVTYKQPGSGPAEIPDDLIKSGPLRVGAQVEIKVADKRDLVEAVITKIKDGSQYTVVFNDGDIATLKRTALCLKSGKHFSESYSLDTLPLTNPEHKPYPVPKKGAAKGRRSRQMNDDSSEDEDEPKKTTEEVASDKEQDIGKVICVEITDSKKKGTKETYFPGLVVLPSPQIRVKDEYLVRSFKDGRYYTVPKKETLSFTRELEKKQDSTAVSSALDYLERQLLPPHWDRNAMFGSSSSSSDEEQDQEQDLESDDESSDDEPIEEKDHFVAQLYKFMDDRGTPFNKTPIIANKDVDLYRLYRFVHTLGGFNKVTHKKMWKYVAKKIGYQTASESIITLVKNAYKKYLLPFEDFEKKLGCSLNLNTRFNRSKGRSLVRARTVAQHSQKDASASKTPSTPSISSSLPAPVTATIVSAPPPQPVVEKPEEPEIKTESIDLKNKRKASTSSGKVKSIIEKFEEKSIKEKEAKDLKDKEAKDLKEAKELKERELREKEREEKKEKQKEIDEKEKLKSLSSSSTTSTSTGGGSAKKGKEKKVDDKRGRKKKDEPETEKKQKVLYMKSQSKPGGITNNVTGNSNDLVIEVGDQLEVYYAEQKHPYEAKVLEIADQEGYVQYFVHYKGWNSRYDEWVKIERIAQNITKKKKGQASGSSSGKSDKEKSDKDRENNKPMSGGPTAQSANSSTLNSGNASSSSTASESKVLASQTVLGSGGKGAGKRTGTIRSRADTTNSSRSTTPLSNTSTSRTKSPATAGGSHRRVTRAKPNTFRRTSNNTDISSLHSDDSDIDSDEPIKKPSNSTNLHNKDKETVTSSTIIPATASSTEPSSVTSKRGGDESKIKSSSSSEFSSSSELKRDFNYFKEMKEDLKKMKDAAHDGGKSEDEKSLKSKKTTAKSNLRRISADLSSSSSSDSCGATASSDSESSNMVPSDVPNSSKSADTSEPETYVPEKFTERATKMKKSLSKWGDKRFEDSDDDSKGSQTQDMPLKNLVGEHKNPSLFEKVVGGVLESSSGSASQNRQTSSFLQDSKLGVGEMSSIVSASSASSMLYSGKSQIPLAKSVAESKILHDDKKEVTASQSSAATKIETTPKKTSIFNQQNKAGRYGQLDKNVVKDGSTQKSTPKKKSSANDIYEFKDTEDVAESLSTTAEKELKKSPLVTPRKSQPSGSLLRPFQNTSTKSSPSAASQQSAVEDIESILKSSIVPGGGLVGKKRKTPMKEDRPSKTSNLSLKKEKEREKKEKVEKEVEMLIEPPKKSEFSTFDVLRKSPNFNLNLANATKDEKADHQIPDDSIAGRSSLFVPMDAIQSAVFTGDSSLLSDESSKNSNQSASEDKSKINLDILVNPNYDIDMPKKSSTLSITDKLLKKMEGKGELQIAIGSDFAVKKEESTIGKPPEISIPSVSSSTSINTTSTTTIEPPVIIKPESPDLSAMAVLTANLPSTKKPLLASPDPRIDILEKTPKNNDLSDTIQRLKSGLGKSQQIDNYGEDSSDDSMDSEHRLVIEDESQIQSQMSTKPSTTVPALPISASSTVCVSSSNSQPPSTAQLAQKAYDIKQQPILESIMMQNDVPYKIGGPNPQIIPVASSVSTSNNGSNTQLKEESEKSAVKSEIKHESDKEQEAMQQLLCEETIPGSPGPVVKDPIISEVSKRSMDDISSSAFIQPQSIISISSNNSLKSQNVMTALQHQQQQLTASLSTTTNLKQIDMDIDTEITSNINMPGNNPLGGKHKSDRGSATSSGNNTNNNSDNSPRDSVSQDDQSDIDKLHLDLGSPLKKRKRSRKYSEAEANHKRRRVQLIKSSHHNDSDSEDNSDPAFPRHGRFTGYNFLVQLDPAMSPSQRITTIKKKIQELKKAYLLVKSELIDMERRRKKLKRREREKNAAKVH